MKSEELEDLLKRVPDLAPSPDLEARIVDAAKRRTAARPRFRGLIPAAAALLFCVGVVWTALPTPGGKGKPEGPFIISFLQDGGRWTTSPADLDGLLPKVKARGIVFAGSSTTPWGQVQSVRRACVKAGIAQVEWLIADKRLKIAIPPPPPPRNPGAPEPIRLEDIVVVMYRERGQQAIVRRVGSRKPVNSDEELQQLVVGMRSDYRKAGKVEFPVFIDSDKDVPWGEVAHVIELCRKNGFEDINLDSPAALYKMSDPLWTPDMPLYSPERK